MIGNKINCLAGDPSVTSRTTGEIGITLLHSSGGEKIGKDRKGGFSVSFSLSVSLVVFFFPHACKFSSLRTFLSLSASSITFSFHTPMLRYPYGLLGEKGLVVPVGEKDPLISYASTSLSEAIISPERVRTEPKAGFEHILEAGFEHITETGFEARNTMAVTSLPIGVIKDSARLDAKAGG